MLSPDRFFGYARRAVMTALLACCFVSPLRAQRMAPALGGADAGTVSATDGLPPGAEWVELASGTVIRFYVTHLHGGGLAGRCYGQLDIGSDTITYQPADRPNHAFSTPRLQVTAKAPGLGPEVHLYTPAGRERFIIVDRDMVERVRSVLATRAHTKDPNGLVAVLSKNGPAVAVPQGWAALPSPKSTDTSVSLRPTHAAPPGPAGSTGTGTAGRRTHLYRLEEQLDFNVLDGAYFDPVNGQVTLYGHREPRYQGPQIPYLQHLAALLENPRPEMTLDWTPDSQRQVNAFLNRAETRADAQRAARTMANFLGPDGRVNDIGRLLLPGWGVTPTRNGAARRGYLGVETAQHQNGHVQVVRVASGSPAAAVGIKPGDIITACSWGYPLTPAEFARRVGYAGEGYEMNVQLMSGQVRWLKLGAAAEDPWQSMDQAEVNHAVMRAAGKLEQAYAVDGMYRLDRVNDAGTDLVQWIDDLGLTNVRLQIFQRYGQSSTAVVELYRAMCRRLEEIFHVPAGTISNPFEHAYGRGQDINAANRAFFDILHRLYERTVNDSLTALRTRREGVLIAPELVDRAWNTKPTVQPRFMGVRADTQLARVMLEADYLGKRLVNQPALKARLPAYQTQYEFLQRNPRFDRDRAEYRMWISVGRFAGAQSADRSTFEIRDIAMRFNIREIRGGRNLPPQSGDYQELLTSLYDDLSREYFILHEVREAAKLAGIAEWIRSRDPRYRLPTAGAPPWRSPATLPGLMFVYLGGGDAGGTAMMTTFATGGVALTPFEHSGRASLDDLAPVDASVVDLRDLPSGRDGLPVVQPPAYENAALRRILNRSSEMPMWRPEGWVGRASKGGRTLQFVSARRADPRCDSIAQADLLRQLELKAKQLDQLERLINQLNAASPRLQTELPAIAAELEQDRDQFVEDSLSLLTSRLVDARELIKARHLAQAAGRVAEASELVEFLQSSTERLEAARTAGRKEKAEAMAGVLNDIREALDDLSSPRAAAWQGLLSPFGWLDTIKEWTDHLGSFGKLMTFQTWDVERLNREIEERNAALKALDPLHKRLGRDVDALRRHPALAELCPPVDRSP